jgi:hypothetical protein
MTLGTSSMAADRASFRGDRWDIFGPAVAALPIASHVRF